MVCLEVASPAGHNSNVVAEHMSRVAFALALALIAPTCLAIERADIVATDDGSGGIHLSNRGDPSRPAQLVVSHARIDMTPVTHSPPLGQSGPTAHPRSEFAEIVHAQARAQNLDPRLLAALVGVESNHVARAVSARGALGLMQLMPSTARDYGVTDPFDPEQNVRAGARHLRGLLNQFQQDTTLALAAYNAGAGAVWRHGRHVPPYAETLSYVPKVLSRYAALQRESAMP